MVDLTYFLGFVVGAFIGLIMGRMVHGRWLWEVEE